MEEALEKMKKKKKAKLENDSPYQPEVKKKKPKTRSQTPELEVKEPVLTNLTSGIQKVNEKKAQKLQDLMQKCHKSLVLENKTNLQPKIAHVIAPIYTKGEFSDDEKAIAKRKRIIGSTSTEDMNTPDNRLITKAEIGPKTEAQEGSLKYKNNHTDLEFG